ncbi:MAG: helix-hairpin-helix domain-containing protein [Methylococcales bacterium]|nr:helix-hairpin-helix domain-containing protein [Methylococcales bacterium]
MKKLLLALTILFSINVMAKPVNINTADAEKIADSISGFGLKKAQTIVDYRTKNGEFKSLDDLNKVSGIGDKTIEKIKADILFSDVSSSTPVATPVTATDHPRKK